MSFRFSMSRLILALAVLVSVPSAQSQQQSPLQSVTPATLGAVTTLRMPDEKSYDVTYLYQLTNDRVYEFAGHDSIETAQVVVRDLKGNTIRYQNVRKERPRVQFMVPRMGQYYVSLSIYRSSSPLFRFALNEVSQVKETVPTLELEERFQGGLAMAGATQSHEIQLQAGKSYFFQFETSHQRLNFVTTVSNSDGLSFSIVGPDGKVIKSAQNFLSWEYKAEFPGHLVYTPEKDQKVRVLVGSTYSGERTDIPYAMTVVEIPEVRKSFSGEINNYSDRFRVNDPQVKLYEIELDADKYYRVTGYGSGSAGVVLIDDDDNVYPNLNTQGNKAVRVPRWYSFRVNNISNFYLAPTRTGKATIKILALSKGEGGNYIHLKPIPEVNNDEFVTMNSWRGEETSFSLKVPAGKSALLHVAPGSMTKELRIFDTAKQWPDSPSVLRHQPSTDTYTYSIPAAKYNRHMVVTLKGVRPNQAASPPYPALLRFQIAE